MVFLRNNELTSRQYTQGFKLVQIILNRQRFAHPMESQSDLQAKLAYLNAKWSEGTESMSAEEKQRHVDMLQEVLNAMGSMQKDLKKSVARSNPDACVLRAYGQFPRGVDGSFMYPRRIDIQESIARFIDGRNNGKAPMVIEVESTFVEFNFNYIQNGQYDTRFFNREEEFYLKFASQEQADFVIKSTINQGFMVPVSTLHRCSIQLMESDQKSSTREAYRTVGNLLVRLKEIDLQCKKLGAVPGEGMLPVLPDSLVQFEVFDDNVRANEENIRDVGVIAQHFDRNSLKKNLHGFLCTHTRVDRAKRQKTLDPLIDERIEILKKLSKINPDEYPFEYDRAFK